MLRQVHTSQWIEYLDGHDFGKRPISTEKLSAILRKTLSKLIEFQCWFFRAFQYISVFHRVFSTNWPLEFLRNSFKLNWFYFIYHFKQHLAAVSNWKWKLMVYHSNNVTAFISNKVSCYPRSNCALVVSQVYLMFYFSFYPCR